jgi:hypothetical protein
MRQLTAQGDDEEKADDTSADDEANECRPFAFVNYQAYEAQQEAQRCRRNQGQPAKG